MDVQNKILDGKGLSTLIGLIKTNYTKTEDLAGVAISGDYSDLVNAPTTVSSFSNDANYAVTSALTSYVLKSGDTMTGSLTITNNGELNIAKLGKTLSIKTWTQNTEGEQTVGMWLQNGSTSALPGIYGVTVPESLSADSGKYVATVRYVKDYVSDSVSPVVGLTGTVIANIAGKSIYAPVAEGGVQIESDPVFTASVAYGITTGDIDRWDSAISTVSVIPGITSGIEIAEIEGTTIYAPSAKQSFVSCTVNYRGAGDSFDVNFDDYTANEVFEMVADGECSEIVERVPISGESISEANLIRRYYLEDATTYTSPLNGDWTIFRFNCHEVDSDGYRYYIQVSQTMIVPHTIGAHAYMEQATTVLPSYLIDLAGDDGSYVYPSGITYGTLSNMLNNGTVLMLRDEDQSDSIYHLNEIGADYIKFHTGTAVLDEYFTLTASTITYDAVTPTFTYNPNTGVLTITNTGLTTV